MVGMAANYLLLIGFLRLSRTFVSLINCYSGCYVTALYISAMVTYDDPHSTMEENNSQSEIVH